MLLICLLGTKRKQAYLGNIKIKTVIRRGDGIKEFGLKKKMQFLYLGTEMRAKVPDQSTQPDCLRNKQRRWGYHASSKKLVRRLS